MKKDRKCKYCEQIFKHIEGKVFSNHVRWCNKNNNYNHKKYVEKLKNNISRKLIKCSYCDKEISIQKIRCHEKSCSHNPKNYKECLFCGKHLINKNNKFCNHSCAASYTNLGTKHKESTKERIANSVKTVIQENKSQHGNNYYSNITTKWWCERTISETEKKEKYKKNPNRCVICTKKLSYKNKKRKTCSEKCLSKRFSNVAKKNELGGKTNGYFKSCWYFNENEGKEVYLDSSWEKKYAKWLDKNDIVWTRPSFFTWKDNNDNLHKYFPDFYLIEDDVYIDIKNPHLMFLEETRNKIKKVKEQNDITLKVFGKKYLTRLGIKLY